MLAGGRGSGLKQLCPLISLCRQSLRLMQTEAEFLELPAPYGVGSRRRSMLMPRGSRLTGDEGPIYAAFIAISRPTRRTRLSALRPDIFPLGTVGQLACPSVAQMLREVTEVTRGFGLSTLDSKNCLDFAHASAEQRTCSENSPSSSPLRRRSAAVPAPAGR
jgi:hypothetical protein